MPFFTDFPLQPATLAVLESMKITEPTPIQAEAIPALLAGRDFVGQSPTGSGKTLAYSLPLVERLAKNKRVAQAIILVPTRELAVQVNTVLSKLLTNRRLTTALLVGGRAYGPQISSLRYGSQVIIGTPGRIKDHIDRGTLNMSEIRMCVLDEADEMLDIGFAPAVEEILATMPETRQMALFSATMPSWIIKIREKYLKDAVVVNIVPEGGPQSTIEQIAYQVPSHQKMAALCTLLRSADGESSLVFGKTKFGIEKLGQQLDELGFTVGTLHGNKSQRARDEVLNAFRRGRVDTLLATNVAARGLDIADIYQVINYELPESSELFTHRSGRTGRMGKQGKAITLLAPSEIGKWRRMSRHLGHNVILQKFVIDPNAETKPAPAKAEAAVTPEVVEIVVMAEKEQQQPVKAKRDRKAEPFGQERKSFLMDEESDLQAIRERTSETVSRKGRHERAQQKARKWQHEGEEAVTPRWYDSDPAVRKSRYERDTAGTRQFEEAPSTRPRRYEEEAPVRPHSRQDENEFQPTPKKRRYEEEEEMPRARREERAFPPVARRRYEEEEAPARRSRQEEDNLPLIARRRRYEDEDAPARRPRRDEASDFIPATRRARYEDDEAPVRRPRRDEDEFAAPMMPRRYEEEESSFRSRAPRSEGFLRREGSFRDDRRGASRPSSAGTRKVHASAPTGKVGRKNTGAKARAKKIGSR